mmetsp:Transcript_11330/g.30917  ORF Transcript_11330/g.30917 Transcript_11330/m.30917 type:complete len:235 (-) Transcript_11330:12-716(-)
MPMQLWHKAVIITAAAAVAPVWTSEPYGEAAQATALAGDDPCYPGTGQCAISALQVRQWQGAGKEGQRRREAVLATGVGTNASKSSSRRRGSHRRGTRRRRGPAHGHHGQILTLYHMTSPARGRSILRSTFRPGRAGYCGGGIYFARTPRATYTKTATQGFIIEARVDIGRVKHLAEKHCTSGPRAPKILDNRRVADHLRHWHADSIIFNPGDGDEVVIADSHRVISMRHWTGR